MERRPLLDKLACAKRMVGVSAAMSSPSVVKRAVKGRASCKNAW